MRHRLRVDGLGAVYLAGNVLSNLIIRSQMPWHAENGVRILGIALLIVLAFSRSEWLHRILFAVAVLALMIFLGSVQFWLG